MAFFSIFFALLIEQFRPLDAARFLYAPLRTLAAAIERRFNGGQRNHGIVAWCVIVIPALLITLGLCALASSLGQLAVLLFNVAVLYVTMGFRHVSHFFTRTHAALRAGDLAQARHAIGAWRGHLHEESGTEEVCRLTIEEALVASHRQVFGVIIAFVLLGAPGAVLYRLSAFLAPEWRGAGVRWQAFGGFAEQAFAVIDWLPARITAVAFAIVGDFEDAAYCWRTQSPAWQVRADGVLIASGSGALGVRVGGPIHENGEIVERPDMGTGDEADVAYLQSTVGLVRRTLVLAGLCLLFLAIAGMAV